LYKKSEVLFGIDKALPEITRTGKAFVVEGYMDWIAAWNAGIKNVVASCGTSFTDNHAKILKRHVKKITFLFDGDKPGREALERSIPKALEADLTVSVIVLPNDQDPDDFFKAGGKLENIKPMSGLIYLESINFEMSDTYKKLLRLERLEAGMLWFAANNSDVAAVLAKRGKLHELFDADTSAVLSDQLHERSE